MMEQFDHKILEKIGKQLLAQKTTVAVAESVTSGLLQYAFSAIPDAACFYQGGITTYNLGQKYKHLLVEPIHAQMVNCVSADVANQMAREVTRLFKSDWGLAVTGYASPVPESGQKLFAFYCIVYKEKFVAQGRLKATQKDPQQVQLYYSNQIVQKFAQLLKVQKE